MKRKRATWALLMALLATAAAMLLHSAGSFGGPVLPYAIATNQTADWSGIEMRFQTESVAEGKQMWRYIRDGADRWRLDVLQGAQTGDIRIYTGAEYYAYNASTDVLTITQQSGERLEASNILVPEIAVRVGDAAVWRVGAISEINGFRTVEMVRNDGTERFWINPEKGIPVQYTNQVQRWSLVDVAFGRTHPAALFAPPPAKRVVHPTPERQRP